MPCSFWIVTGRYIVTQPHPIGVDSECGRYTEERPTLLSELLFDRYPGVGYMSS